MERNFTKSLLLFLFFNCFWLSAAFAQTITIGAIDPGPYGQGSTIAVPFNLNTAATCASSTNVFNIYLSDASGNFGAPKLIGSYAGFYGTFVNGIIPAGTPAGSNYRVRIEATDPAIPAVISSPFSISSAGGVIAAVATQAVNVGNPEVFGSCIGVANTSYSFTNISSPGATATAKFYNELDKVDEGTIGINGSFIAKAANYTVMAKAVSGGVVGTKAYTLINNVVNNGINVSGTNQVCLNGKNKLSYNWNITDPKTGIQVNYPGLIYNVNWGDGTTTNYTLCEIVNAGGQIEHTYTKSSCGNVANGQANVFQIDFQPVSPYCGKVGTLFTTYALIISPPKNIISGPKDGCTNKAISFTNNSIPGQDPNSTSFDCTNINALYSWYVDGELVAPNFKKEQSFNYTFSTNGQHKITLHLQNPGGICDVEDQDETICIQNAPQPSFDLKGGSIICTSGFVTPSNNSVVDKTCNPNYTYNWTITGPAPVTFAAGTSKNSETPTFDFETSGQYTVQLGITPPGCDEVLSEIQTVTVNLTPTASLSPNTIICGTGRILSFNPEATETKTTLTGTAGVLTTTFSWTVTGGTYSFVNGTSEHSQYPDILVNDVGDYTFTVIHTNNCGSVTRSQKITIQAAPIINSGGDQSVCEGNIVTLAGSITGVTNSYRWIGGSGTFIPDRNALQPQYIPSADEIAAGTVTVSLEATTNLAAPCNLIVSPAVITITRKDHITSPEDSDVCTGQPFHYDIISANPLSTFNWTASVTSGTATGFTAVGSGNAIDDVITAVGTVDAEVTYTITPVTNDCSGKLFTLTLNVNQIPVLSPVPPASVCTGAPAGITLTPTTPNTTYTWTSVADPGVTGNTAQASAVSATEIGDILVNSNTGSGKVIYTITPYHGACAGQPIEVTIAVVPLPVAPNAGIDESTCLNSTFQLKGNDPSPGTGKWTLTTGPTAVTFSSAADPNATVSGLTQPGVYTFSWEISASASCPNNFDEVNITVDAPTVAGTAEGATSVCAGANNGILTLTGNLGNVLSWEYTTDGVNWLNLSDATPQYEYTNLTQTTQFRAVVQNGNCAVERSTAVTVTVNQPVMAADAGVPQQPCNASSITLAANDPTPYSGFWTQTDGPPVLFADVTDPKTQVTGLVGGNTYTFVWTIKGLVPCADSSDPVTIINNPDIIPSFTADNTALVCGPLSVRFTNTSTPNFPTTVYAWDFGDGSATTNEISPEHTFQPRTDGKDTVYTVSLAIVNNCLPRSSFTYEVLVRPAAPIARMLPDRLNGCGTYAIVLHNISPGNNQYYDFFVYDGSTLIQTIRKTDKTDARFDPLTPPVSKAYTVYMVATDFCGNTSETSRPRVTIGPATFVAQMFAKDNNRKGCLPFSTTFVNNSSGGDRFTYQITDANNNVLSIQGTANETPYTFTQTGVFYVKIMAINDCAEIVSKDSVRFEVNPVPQANFDATIPTGCKSLTVDFVNLTQASGSTPAQSLSYDWNFGDGTPHFTGFAPLPHTYYPKNSPFTVTLTVTNLATGCTSTITKPNFVTVSGPPNADFVVKPDTITKIPNYHFEFDDRTSNNPAKWLWTFGDGATSNSQNTNHTYADTGVYKVTLLVTNRDGCDSLVTHTVRITGTPGQLYMPNAFMPATGTTELQVFAAKGSGIKTWRMQIFNNSGQLMWETTKLNSAGEPVEAWDGTFKGAPVQQGVYIWQASAQFINGTDWKGMSYNGSLPKRTGVIHLIR